MTVKQFRSKYKGVTPKVKRQVPTVNRKAVDSQLDFEVEKKRRQNQYFSKAKNEGYEIVQRLTDDPEYLRRANQVKQQLRIQTSDYRLYRDALNYAEAVLIQDKYVNGFINYECIEEPNFEDNTYLDKPQYMVGVHSEFSPDLAQYQINSLKDPDLFTKEELIKILNTFILENYRLETEKDERSDRHGNDNATVSDTELQGWRDTHKEKEQGKIQCPKEENR